MADTRLLVVCFLALLVCAPAGCLAGGASPRRDAYASVGQRLGADLAGRVTRDEQLDDAEVAKLLLMVDAGNQDVVYCLLANGNVPRLAHLYIVERSDGWGLQGIRENHRLHGDDAIRRMVEIKPGAMAKDVYRRLWGDLSRPDASPR